MNSKPQVLVLPPPSLYDALFTPESDASLRAHADVTLNPEERHWDAAELAQKIGDYDAVITGWGSPTFTDEVLRAAGRLRLIAHSAGSIKKLLPPPVFARGIAVTHAAGAIAPAVAEMTLTLILLCLRRVPQLDQMLKRGGEWNRAKEMGMGRELAGSRVGVVGAGYTGTCVIRLLNAFGAQVWAHDPYLSAERARELGVHPVSTLDEIFRECPIVTLQAPPTPETHRMVGSEQLRLLRDGAIFINTARAHLVDEAALLAELRTGRFQAALDVFDQEPLPVESPFRQLDNVIITPHVAGASLQARQRQGQIIVEEIVSFFRDETLRYQVTGDMLDTMA
jgi:phosphoglycerate dehydrogenase-like enzyme